MRSMELGVTYPFPRPNMRKQPFSANKAENERISNVGQDFGSAEARRNPWVSWVSPFSPPQHHNTVITNRKEPSSFMKIPYIIEPEFEHSVWADRTINGLRREAALKKYDLVGISPDFLRDRSAADPAVFENRMVIVIGMTYSWVPETVRILKDCGLSVILIHFDPPEGFRPRATVHVDYTQAMQLIVRYLHDCGREKIALYGLNPNSSTDILKRSYMETVLNAAPDTFFMSFASLSDCYAAFSRKMHAFDAVICANDIAAVSLLSHLKADGCRVPEDLFLISFGQSVLASHTDPGITSVSLDYSETGQQAVRLFAWLSRQEELSSVSVRVRAVLTVRGSTASLPAPDTYDEITGHLPQHDNINFYSDLEAKKLLNLEQLLMKADDMDHRIIQGLLKGQKQEILEDRLFLSESALRYRLKKLCENAGCASRSELLMQLKEWEEYL